MLPTLRFIAILISLGALAVAARAGGAVRPHVLPGLSGTGGLVDVPVAFTTPYRRAVVSLQLDRARADGRYFSPYTSVVQAHRYVAVTRGLRRDVEVGFTLESWDKELVFANPVGDVTPTFRTVASLFPGLSAKFGRKLPVRGIDAWGGAGFRFQAHDDGDRNLTEFHEYARFSQVYGVLSAQPGRRLFAHAVARRIQLPGNPTIAGRTAEFVGYAVPASWNQYGAAAEWFLGPRVSVFGEVLEESRIRFRGDLDRTSLNAGARYQDGEKGFGVWGRRLNHDGLSDAGLQMAWQF